MKLSTNRILLSQTDLFTTVNNNSSNKIDLSFTEKRYHLNPEDFKTELELIRSRNYPLLRQVLNAVDTKQIVLCNNNNLKTSVVYVFGTDKSDNISTVFINMARYITTAQAVDPATGNIKMNISTAGGYEELYNLLLSAYIGLKAKLVFNNSKAVSILRNIYADIFSQLMSKSYGNPLDGETFRFIVSHFFYNGDISGQDLGMLLKYNPDRVAALMLKYPGYFERRDGIQLSELIDLICKEFPSLARNDLNTLGFIINSASKIGDNALYILDNNAYFLAMCVAKSRRSKVFTGYSLKPIESDSSTLLATVYQSVV